MNKLDLRNQMNKKKPEFIRQDNRKKKRIKSNWRKPRGIDSKLRLQLKGHGAIVKIGYKTPVEVRGLTKNGLIEVIIENIKDLKKLNEKTVGVISSKVGKRKKVLIIKEAIKKNIKLANADNSTIEKIEAFMNERKSIKEKRKKKLIENDKKSKKVQKEKNQLNQKNEKTEEEKKKEKDKALIKKNAI